MKKQIFCIYDSKAQAYAQPFFLPNEQVAIRSVQELSNDPTHEFYKHAEDYSLYHIGTYSEEQGKLEPIDPKHIASCHTLKKPVNNVVSISSDEE